MNTKVPIYTEEDFEGMRKAGKIAADILDYITDFVDVGVTTGYLDDLCYEKIKEYLLNWSSRMNITFLIRIMKRISVIFYREK